ncbi:trafficking kinesin-binding protein 1-like isoform X2 [Limulus polyphemus]|uniref:Trafficking kinesin-binding protein 1-like isoform X2 n=1 Tax=Limulus polyphemus TaxID=6850 RepID=A0ABM1B2J8_LIMPO|nr:trafficking kinesin-binding protein 1-like isoform X2 [Limulus polyphemus]
MCRTKNTGRQTPDLVPLPDPPWLDLEFKLDRWSNSTRDDIVSCGDRLSQMTKTYNDIEAVRALLEEKEKDLELAARIGQSLLEENKQLTQKNEILEQELANANETITQLKRDLATKISLLQIYSQDLDGFSEPTTPTEQKGHDLELLHRKVHDLEEKNFQLRSEVDLQEATLEEEEKKEMQIIQDFVKEISEAKKQITLLQEELSKKSEDCFRQQEDVTHVLSQIVEFQREIRSLSAENEDLRESLQASKDNQTTLLSERNELKDKYFELLNAFQEVQEENKKVCRTHLPNAKRWNYSMYTPYVNPDSLASELESSLGRDSEGYASDELLSHSKRVFQTVKYAGKSKSDRQRRNTGQLESTPQQKRTRSSLSLSYLSSSSSCFNDSFTSDSESLYAESCHTDDESRYSSFSSLGRPGAPGSTDFEVALSRLGDQDDFAAVLRSGDPVNEPSTTEDEMSKLNYDFSGNSELLRRLSIISGSTNRSYHMPEKLQIIKPLEGSQTLHHWQRLATPHLGGIFETRPGIQIKGEVHLPELEPDTFTLSDFEEDEAYYQPGKNNVETSSTYTFTNSTVMYPLNQNQIFSSSSAPEAVETRVVQCMEIESNAVINTEESLNFSKSKTSPGLSTLHQEQRIRAIVPSVDCSGHDVVAAPASSDPAPTALKCGLFPTLTTHSTASHSQNTPWQSFQVSNTPTTTTIHTTCTTPTPVIHNTVSPGNLIENLNVVSITKKALTAETTRSMFSSKLPVFCIPRFSNLYGLTTVPDNSPLTLSYKQNCDEDDISTENIDLDLQCEEQKIEDNLEHHETIFLPHNWGHVPPFSFKTANPIFQIYNPGVGGSYVGLLSTLHALRKGGFT